MICSNCGSETEGKFCSSCGAPTNSAVADREPAATPTVFTNQNETVDLYDVMSVNGKKRLPLASALMAIGIPMKDSFAAADNFLILVKDVPEPSFGQMLANQAESIAQVKQRQKDALASKQDELDAQGVVYCPKCLSTSVSADKKGFGIGKAVVGRYLGGPLGLMAGNLGAKKVRVTCLKCGHQWWAGKA